LSKGYYEVPTRPKSKVDSDVVTTPMLVASIGEGLLLKKGSSFGPVKMIMACGWTILK
jgi:hypothetical protein